MLCPGGDIIINTNTVGMSFKTFYECVKKISETFISDGLIMRRLISDLIEMIVRFL